MPATPESDAILRLDDATVQFQAASSLRRRLLSVAGDAAGDVSRPARYGIREVHLNLKAGQRVALVGPSGCGKTTLLRVIAGLQPLTGGSLLGSAASDGQGRDSSALQAAVSFVFQQPALLPWRRVLDNVTLPLELTRRSKKVSAKDSAVATAEAVLREVNLGEVTDQFPHQLSGGMQMRVSIARALVTEPQLLLLDEPFAALDDLLRNQLGELVTGLWRQHRFTMVLVTHNIAEAISLCDRICVMGDGRLTGELINPLDRSTGHDIRRTPEFAAFHGEVSDALASANIAEEACRS